LIKLNTLYNYFCEFSKRRHPNLTTIYWHADYSEVVIKKQREQWPEIDWVVMDCLHMKDAADESFGKQYYTLS